LVLPDDRRSDCGRSDLLIGICAEEFLPQSRSLLGRAPVNYSHADDLADIVAGSQRAQAASAKDTMFSGREAGVGRRASDAAQYSEQEHQKSAALCA
jgi:hypothetical protein